MKQLNSTGIILEALENGTWHARIDFSTWEHGVRTCMSGSVGTHYQCALSEAIDLALDASRAMEIRFDVGPHLYVKGDGEDRKVFLPANWRELVAAECGRLGWPNCYA